ncbi:unnamed protein product [Arabis nemorensis]|uniref:RCC1-like domain-containing protein n=1 Tax=Arabis nemorensis TaxID=586526 RepID=A0A565BET3_9BRAS|nr:unnamed protein product [Arabis nemorensis]
MAEHGGTPTPSDEEQVWSWGAGTDGQLGTAKLQDEHLPKLLSLTSLPSISMLACGGAHVIALTSGGKVMTWGRGNAGQLGHGDILNTCLPKLVSFFDDYVITQATAGWSHSGFVSESGRLFTCGNGSFGQLGHGDNMSLTTPAKVSYFVNNSVKMVACGMRHSLVLLTGNQVYGFGSDKRGQLGVSSDRTKSVNLPCVISGFEDVELMDSCLVGEEDSAAALIFKPLSVCLHLYLSFREVALGWNHALLLTVDGEVFKLGNTLNNDSGVVGSQPDEVLTSKDSEINSGNLENLNDDWEFKENEIIYAQNKLRSTRAKLAVLEGKMAMARIDAQRIVREKQRKIDHANRALRLLRTASIVWPNSASEVLLTGSFDGWSTQVSSYQ